MKLHQVLSDAVLQLLQPLVRVLLRHGLSCDEFAELARRSYVEVAERDFALAGRKQTISRISVITGLNRKEVARLQALNAKGDAGGAELARAMNRAAKVVVGWRHEHQDAGGTPRALDTEQFAQLVRRHSGDMPARAVLDELRAAGAVTTDADGRYRLGREGYGPKATDLRKISLLGQHAADLLDAIDHNLAHPPEQAWLQQRVFADHIPAEQIEAVRALLGTQGREALDEARATLIEHDGGDTTPAPGARRVTFAVYYAEQAVPEPAAVAPSGQPAPLTGPKDQGGV